MGLWFPFQCGVTPSIFRFGAEHMGNTTGGMEPKTRFCTGMDGVYVDMVLCSGVDSRKPTLKLH